MIQTQKCTPIYMCNSQVPNPNLRSVRVTGVFENLPLTSMGTQVKLGFRPPSISILQDVTLLLHLLANDLYIHMITIWGALLKPPCLHLDTPSPLFYFGSYRIFLFLHLFLPHLFYSIAHFYIVLCELNIQIKII